MSGSSFTRSLFIFLSMFNHFKHSTGCWGTGEDALQGLLSITGPHTEAIHTSHKGHTYSQFRVVLSAFGLWETIKIRRKQNKKSEKKPSVTAGDQTYYSKARALTTPRPLGSAYLCSKTLLFSQYIYIYIY